MKTPRPNHAVDFGAQPHCSSAHATRKAPLNNYVVILYYLSQPSASCIAANIRSRSALSSLYRFLELYPGTDRDPRPHRILAIRAPRQTPDQLNALAASVRSLASQSSPEGPGSAGKHPGSAE